MRRAVFCGILLAFLNCTGCAISDVLFGVFGGHYSEGGDTPTERKYHYDQQLEKWRHHDGGRIDRGSLLESNDYYGVK